MTRRGERFVRFLMVVTWLFIVAPAMASGTTAKSGSGTTKGSSTVTKAPASTGDPTLWRLATGYDVHHSTDAAFSAQVYQSHDYKSLLVLPDEGGDCWALDLAALKVYALTVPEIGLTEGKVRVPKLAGRTVLEDLERHEASVSFAVSGGAITLTPGEPLVGEVPLALLLKRRPDYVASASRYEPDPTAIAILKTRKSPAEILVAFGTWCNTCKRVVPTFIRTMELAANPSIKVRYIAINEDKSEPKAMITALGVKTTPTFSIRAGGKEIGRIAGVPATTIERELVNILTKAN